MVPYYPIAFLSLTHTVELLLLLSLTMEAHAAAETMAGWWRPARSGGGHGKACGGLRGGGGIKIKKLYPGKKRPHRFFIKRKPHRLTRVEKTPEPWPMPERAKSRGEHSEGFFLPQQPKIRF